MPCWTQEDSLILKLIEKMDINKEYFINRSEESTGCKSQSIRW